MQHIYEEAEAAAIAAAKAHDAQLPPEAQRGLDCGFAWVEVRPARGAFITWCRKNGKGSKHWRSGWQFWNPSHHGTQSIGTKVAGARAFAEVLRKYGIDASVDSRLD